MTIRSGLIVLALVMATAQCQFLGWGTQLPQGGTVNSVVVGFGMELVGTAMENNDFGFNYQITVVNISDGTTLNSFPVRDQVDWIKFVDANSLIFMTWKEIRKVSIQGLPMWTAPAPSNNWASFPEPYLMDDATMGYFYTSCGIYAISLSAGTVTKYWEDAMGYHFTTAPAFASIGGKDAVLMPTAGHLTGVDAKTGNEMYRAATTVNLDLPLSIGSTMVVSGSASLVRPWMLLALDIASGSQVWAAPAALDSSNPSNPVAGLRHAKDTSGNSYLAALCGEHVFKLDPMSGGVVLKVRAPAVQSQYPLALIPGPYNATDGTWYMVDVRGDVYAFDTVALAFKWASLRPVGAGFYSGFGDQTYAGLERADVIYAGFGTDVIKISKATGNVLAAYSLAGNVIALAFDDATHTLLYASQQGYGSTLNAQSVLIDVEIGTPIVVSSNVAYFGTLYHVYGVDTTGAVTMNVSVAPGFLSPSSAPVVIANGNLYLSGFSPEYATIFIVALSTGTVSTVSVMQTADCAPINGYASFATDGTNVFFTAGINCVYMLNTQNSLSHFAVPGNGAFYVVATPVVGGGVVVVQSSDGYLYSARSNAFTTATATPLPVSGAESGLAVIDGYAYIGTGGGRFFCFNATSLNIIYQTFVGSIDQDGTYHQIDATPLASGSNVVISNAAGFVAAYATGTTTPQMVFSAQIQVGEMLPGGGATGSDGTVYYAGNNGVSAVSAAGAGLWNASWPGGCSNVVVGNHLIAAVCTNGNFYPFVMILDRKTGATTATSAAFGTVTVNIVGDSVFIGGGGPNYVSVTTFGH